MSAQRGGDDLCARVCGTQGRGDDGDNEGYGDEAVCERDEEPGRAQVEWRPAECEERAEPQGRRRDAERHDGGERGDSSDPMGDERDRGHRADQAGDSASNGRECERGRERRERRPDPRGACIDRAE